jgi:hypothetical protein
MTEDQKKTEVVMLMLESLNNDNRMICANNGMSDAEIEKSIEQSQGSLGFMLSNLYDKLKSENLLAV